MYEEGLAIGGLALMLGHDFPMLLGFKGGKGIMSGCVIAFINDWRVGALILGLFLVFYLITGYVSLGSLVGAVSFAVGFGIFHWDNPVVAGCGIFMGALAVFMHRGNIARLIKGEEKKTNLFGKGKRK
jgi:glycerol-3-phosphate acyltransferase PlsY